MIFPRWLILRRIVQACVLLLFFGSAHWGWTLFGAPLLRGNLSASSIADAVPLADPYATLQILASGQAVAIELLIGALIILVLYAIVGGRMFCSWVCPVNPVTDFAGWLRRRLGLGQGARLSRSLRFWILGLSFPVSAIAGVAAFENVSPIAMTHRGILFLLPASLIALGAIFLFDLLFARSAWCGHLCPLGAFYGIVGRVARLRIGFDDDSCTHCGDCYDVCPEPQVLQLKRAAVDGFLIDGNCSNCGRCATICPEKSLFFMLRPSQNPKTKLLSPRSSS